MNNKRLRNKLFTMLMLVMALLIPQWGWAQTASKPAVGDGSKDNPFQITSVEELVWFRDWVNEGPSEHTSACAKLMNNIDMGNTYWTRIGNPFYRGTFDGNGKIVSNFKIRNNTNFNGFFGFPWGATIRNITFDNADINCSSYSGIGILAGEIEETTISGIKIKNSKVTGNRSVGGIVGYSGNSTITNCEINASVSGKEDVGGIVGALNKTNTFNNILSLSEVTYTNNGGLLFGSFLTEAEVHCVGAVVYDKESMLSSNESELMAIGNGSLASGFTLGCSKQMLKSGVITFILQQKNNSDDVIWGQNLSDGGDAYPVLGSTCQVYANDDVTLSCDGRLTYTENFSNIVPKEDKILKITHSKSPIYVAGTAATCTSRGILSHYKCSNCQCTYKDESLSQEIVDITDPLKSHTYNSDDVCTMCNQKIPELVVGDNTIKINEVTPSYDRVDGYNLFKFMPTKSGVIEVTNSVLVNYALWDNNKTKQLYLNYLPINEKIFWTVTANTIYYIGLKTTNNKAIESNCTLTIQLTEIPNGLVGRGVVSDPFILKNADHLKFFADYVNGTGSVASEHLKACAKIADDVIEIDMSNICHAAGNGYGSEASWTPIGSSNVKWKGVFDGNGKTISNLYINANTGNVGMFGYAHDGSVIKNLTLKKAIVRNEESQDNSGILVGRTYHTTIQNIVIDSESSISAGSNTGGIVGYTEFFSEISNCINCADVKGSINVGGIVGVLDTRSLENVFNNGNIIAKATAGLIVGDNKYSLSGVFAYNKDATFTINGTLVEAKATGSGSLSSTAYTKDEVRSGKLTYALNNGVTDGSQIWYQKLGEDGDEYPMMKSTGENTVYGAYHHGDKDRFFSNTVITNQHSVAYNAEAENEENGNHDVSYEAGEYTWTDAEDKTQDPTVAVTYTCKVCEKAVTPEQMTVEHDAEHYNDAPSCTEEGHNYYKTSYTFNAKAVFSDAYTQTLPALGHDMPKEEVFFNEEKKIYMNYCQRNCDYYEYYITSDGSIKAMPYGEHENLFTLGSLSLDDATLYDTKARYDVWNFTYNRTFENDRWQALYVPFDLKCFQIADDYEVATINNFHEYEQTDGNIKLVLEVKVTQKTIPALTPCVIRKKKAPETRTVESLVFEDVQFEPSANKTYDCASVARYYQFTGMLQAKDGFNVNQDFLMNGGMLYKAEADAQLSPHRWYLSATDRSGNSSVVEQLARVKSISINVVGEDDTTGIEDIYVTTDIEGVQSSRHGIYDLQGRKLSQEPLSGVYIKDGKKYVK